MAKAAFFFGSGIAYDSKAPSVTAITGQLFGHCWIAHTDSRYYPNPNKGSSASAGDAQRAQEFLRRVRDKIAPHIHAREHRDPNYEDIYASAFQILQDEISEIINPLIADSVGALKREVVDLLVEQHAHIDDNAFASLADRSCQLVQWAVSYGLSRAVHPVNLQTISEVANAVGDLDIFSLNHDGLIEAQLNNAMVPFADGFGERNGDAWIFNGDWQTEVPAVRLFKLHGSLNRFLFRFKEWDQYAKVHSDVDQARDRDGNLLSLLHPIPQFLTGSTVKELAYSHGVTGETFAAFRRRSLQHRTIICCGYGWGDKGINQRLNQWLREARENRIVLLDPREEQTIAAPRFWTFRWHDYREAKKVIVIPKWLSQCTLDDLRPYFDP